MSFLGSNRRTGVNKSIAYIHIFHFPFSSNELSTPGKTVLLLKLHPTPVTLTAAPEMCVFNIHPVMIIVPVQ